MKRKRAVFLLSCGAVCLIAALGLTGYNLYDEYRAESSAETNVTQLKTVIQDKAPEEQPILPEPQVMMTALELDGRDYVGVLEIPSLELSLPIQDEWSDRLLKYSPCRYEGTIYDGMIIAGHNYKSHFAKLKQLLPGDEVRFIDLDGNIWNYEIVVIDILEPYSVEEMTSGEFDLTLFTCTQGGSHRVTVRCDSKNK